MARMYSMYYIVGAACCECQLVMAWMNLKPLCRCPVTHFSHSQQVANKWSTGGQRIWTEAEWLRTDEERMTK
eukprot:COSAG06_NODE_438_length_15766_cov_6.128997_9_plen_72_part_00